MTPQEKDLVSQLLQRLRRAGAGQEKDPEAEALIRRAMAEQPDAPYYLVQTVLVQELALEEAQQRIAELERRPAAAQPRSFLGGSVPSAGPWARTTEPQGAATPQRGWGGRSAMMAPGASSGFLRNAAATAVGIAGGALLFQGLSSLFGGSNETAAAAAPVEEQLAANEPPAEEGWDAGQDLAAGDWGGDDLV